MLLNAIAGFLTEIPCQDMIVKNSGDRVAKSSLICGRYKQATFAVLDNLGRPTQIKRYTRETMGHGRHERVAESFEKRRQEKNIQSGIDRVDILDETREHNGIGHPQLRGDFFQPGPGGPITS